MLHLLYLLLYQLVHANRGSHHWSKWSQHKSYGTSKFGTGAWAMAWASIQWLLMCTTSANTLRKMNTNEENCCTKSKFSQWTLLSDTPLLRMYYCTIKVPYLIIFRKWILFKLADMVSFPTIHTTLINMYEHKEPMATVEEP